MIARRHKTCQSGTVAHPADPSLTRAVGDVIRSLRGRGWSTQDLADRLGVSSPTITRWENGGRAPSLDVLPRFDTLLERPRGEVLRLAGYVEDRPGDVPAAIMADPHLSDMAKQILVDTYKSAVRRSAAAATA